MDLYNVLYFLNELWRYKIAVVVCVNQTSFAALPCQHPTTSKLANCKHGLLPSRRVFYGICNWHLLPAPASVCPAADERSAQFAFRRCFYHFIHSMLSCHPTDTVEVS